MPVTKETRRTAGSIVNPPDLSEALSALIAAAEPNKPPTEDEILSLILDDLARHGMNVQHPGRA